MPAAVMRKPVPAKGASGVKRPAPSAAKHHHETPVKPMVSTVTIVVAGSVAIATLFGLIWAFGSAGLQIPATPPAAAGKAAPGSAAAAASTRVYRDMHDGRVMVMEVDGNGTRIIGTMSKDEVGLATDNLPTPERRGLDTQQRLNALGTPFRH